MRWNRRTGLIGVDVGTHAVKLAQVERRGGGLALRAAAVVLRRQPWQADDWPAALPRSSVDEIFACRSLGNDFSGRHAACTLPMAICDVRGMTVHAGNPRQQRELVQRELRPVWGAGTEFAFDGWGIPPTKTSDDNVNILSTAQRWSDQIANDHRKSGLACQIMDGLPLALSRAVRLAESNENNSVVAALDWGYTRATFCLMQDHRPVFVRCLRDAGFQQVIDAVCQSLNVSVDEAQQVLGHGGVRDASIDDDELHQLIEEVTAEAVGSVGSELNRTLSFLRSQPGGQMPGRIWLFGGGAAFPQFGQLLGRQVDVPIEIWQPRLTHTTEDTTVQNSLALFGPAIALSALAWEQK